MQVRANSTDSGHPYEVVSVGFEAIQFRELWHPFRHRLRAGEPDPFVVPPEAVELLEGERPWYVDVLDSTNFLD